MKKIKERYFDKFNMAVMCMIVTVGVLSIIRNITWGSAVGVITMCIVELLFAILAFYAWKTRCSLLFLPISVAAFYLAFLMNGYMFGLGMQNWEITAQAAISAVGVIGGTLFLVARRPALQKASLKEMSFAIFVVVVVVCAWQCNERTDRAKKSMARSSIWAVPEVYDNVESTKQGHIEKIIYETKAYATDHRTVEKTAYVYLPFEYENSKPYNILYLMHGTGDDEEYWLKKHSQNKIMLDQMISRGDIDPLIVVTPTFYVEEDCYDDLDKLTYSFKEELRNDLMPVVESSYSTYAETCDHEGFESSRDHRAFAGLSRGAVTTYNSAMFGSLDYFSWFGAFSGSRIDKGCLETTLQNSEFSDYEINYLYMSSGNFDFTLPGQLKDYDMLVDMDSRLIEGVNTSFDIFPMRYHSMGSWHLALYNFLQKIF